MSEANDAIMFLEKLKSVIESEMSLDWNEMEEVVDGYIRNINSQKFDLKDKFLHIIEKANPADLTMIDTLFDEADEVVTGLAGASGTVMLGEGDIIDINFIANEMELDRESEDEQTFTMTLYGVRMEEQ